MVVLRSGKITMIKNKRSQIKQKYKLKECSIRIKILSQSEIQNYLQPFSSLSSLSSSSTSKYNLRQRKVEKKLPSESCLIESKERVGNRR